MDELWHVLFDLGESLDVPWSVMGGQMVPLHALERVQSPPQISQDGDVISDELTAKDRQRLRNATDLLDERHPAWALVPVDVQSNGQIAARALIDPT